MGLLATVLDGLFDAGWFSERTLADLLDFRDAEVSGPIDDLSSTSFLPLTAVEILLNLIAGVSFNSSCSFSMATILVKGMRFSPIADETSALLIKFLLCSRNVDPTVAPVRAGLATHANDGVAYPRPLDSESTPYFLALLPYFARNGRLEELLDLAGLDDLAGAGTTDSQKYTAIAARLSIEDDDTATLAFALLVAQARVADTDSEYLAIYSVMAHISHTFPSAATCLCVSTSLALFDKADCRSFAATISPSPSSTTSSTSAKALPSSTLRTPSSPLLRTTLHGMRRRRARFLSDSGSQHWRRATLVRLRWRSFVGLPLSRSSWQCVLSFSSPDRR